MPRVDATIGDLACAARGGDVRARSRLLSRVENDPSSTPAVLDALGSPSGDGWVVGFTGPPGAGKSTLLGQVARELRRRGPTVAVLAVDPTSPVTGGALLGDRVRMEELSGDSGAYVRSVATRGSAGGVTRAAADLIAVLEAFGYERILIETVGAGQSEVRIAEAAQTVILVDVPHLGDHVQALKAGIIEIADIFVVNKADQDGADRAVAILQSMLHDGDRADGWPRSVLKTSARDGTGVAELIHQIEEHQKFLRHHGQITHHRRQWARRALLEGITDRILSDLLAQTPPAVLDRLIDAVAARRLSLDRAVDQILAST